MEKTRPEDVRKLQEGVNLTFLGTGDAFGHGGRMQPCIMVETPFRRFLMDCGTTATLAMHHFDIVPNDMEFILLSHLHGDHFGGPSFFYSGCAAAQQAADAVNHCRAPGEQGNA